MTTDPDIAQLQTLVARVLERNTLVRQQVEIAAQIQHEEHKLKELRDEKSKLTQEIQSLKADRALAEREYAHARNQALLLKETLFKNVA